MSSDGGVADLQLIVAAVVELRVLEFAVSGYELLGEGIGSGEGDVLAVAFGFVVSEYGINSLRRGGFMKLTGIGCSLRCRRILMIPLATREMYARTTLTYQHQPSPCP